MVDLLKGGPERTLATIKKGGWQGLSETFLTDQLVKV